MRVSFRRAPEKTEMKEPKEIDSAEEVLLDYIERYGLTDRARRYFLRHGQEEQCDAGSEARQPRSGQSGCGKSRVQSKCC